MIPSILTLLVVLPCVAAEVKPVGLEVLRIDLELTLDNYKMVRSEQFKAELQLKLLETDERAGEEEAGKRGLKRLEERFRAFQILADELRAKAVALERELSSGGGGTEIGKSESGEGRGAGEADEAEGELRKRMLGTWQLVSFADGKVSSANVGELKFIGDGYFSVSRLNPRNGKLDYHMGGTYTLDGDEYVETIEYGTTGPIGETFTYKLSVEGDQFTQIGSGNPWSLVFKRAKAKE